MSGGRAALGVVTAALIIWGCGGGGGGNHGRPRPASPKPPHTRVDAYTPQMMVSDWSVPIRIGDPINTCSPEDAIEISADGQYLYFMYAEDVLENLTIEELLNFPSGTYWARRIGGPGDFDYPRFYDLGTGSAGGSLDGECSFSPDGSKVYFHSNRGANLGYQEVPPVDDFLDIYVADIVGGVPGPGVNLGLPVNSIYPDGEHCLHPDGVTLFFASMRPGGLGNSDIYTSTWNGASWDAPVHLDAPVNSADADMQPAFSSDGSTMYFTSDRGGIGMSIYRSTFDGSNWSVPELVIQGIVGEPSLTADGTLLYFVHVLIDVAGVFDADIWYCERQ